MADKILSIRASKNGTDSIIPSTPTNISTPTSPTIDEGKIPNPDFTGKWKLKDYKGIDEYLKSEGWNWMMRKAISKLGNNEFIYHHHRTTTSKSTKDIQNGDTKEEEDNDDQEVTYEHEENITIKSINKGGVYELIPSANLYDKKEVIYKDKNGNKVISVFKWNKEKTEIIEFLLKEIKGSDDDKSSQRSRSNRHRSSQSKPKIKQKSYTKTRYIDNSGQMIVSITNQIGKTCTSVYIKEDDISIKQLKHILHLPPDPQDEPSINKELTKEQKEQERREKIKKDALYEQFPVNIIEIEQKVIKTKDDDEKLNMENIAIQKDIQSIMEQIRELEAKLAIKTEELKENIAINDENIKNRNTIKKWKEFEAEWYNWNALYFMAWLRRLKWNGKKGYDDYDISKHKIDQYSMINFNDSYFLGKFLQKFDRDAVRQIGIEDENDSMNVYQEILNLIKRNPLKRYESPLKYKIKKKEDDDDLEQKEIGSDFKEFLHEMDMIEYYQQFKKNGYDDLNKIIICCKEKGIDYVEKNILSKKLKINKIKHRIKLLAAFKKMMENESDDFENDDEDHDNNNNENANINGVKTEDLL